MCVEPRQGQGVETDQRVDRTKPEQPGEEGDNTDVAPYANFAAHSQSDQHEARGNTQNTIDGSNIRFHLWISLVEIGEVFI
jgi:hypothetical protein